MPHLSDGRKIPSKLDYRTQRDFHMATLRMVLGFLTDEKFEDAAPEDMLVLIEDTIRSRTKPPSGVTVSAVDTWGMCKDCELHRILPDHAFGYCDDCYIPF